MLKSFEPTSINDDLKLQLAFHCAPVFCSLKTACTLTTNPCSRKDFNGFLAGTKTDVVRLAKGKNKIVYMIYRKELLWYYLSQKSIRCFLEEQDEGYVNYSLQTAIKNLQSRMQAFYANTGSFPHELGIFLGCPLADTKAFIKNEGKGCLYSGYWKVYNNVEEAKTLFRTYNATKKRSLYMARQGKSLKEITTFYTNIFKRSMYYGKNQSYLLERYG